MLLTFRPMYTFRERAPEWILSMGLLIWGITMSWHPQVFETEFYQPLLIVASPQTWVVWTTTIGLLRLICLSINGAWRPTPHLRALGSVGALTIWTNLLLASIFDMHIRAGGIAIYLMLVTFEVMALWWAAGDAKIVDVMTATKRKQVIANGSE